MSASNKNHSKSNKNLAGTLEKTTGNTLGSSVIITLDGIPDVIHETHAILKNGGFEAYLVGGCVRDLILGKKPKDWDITTNASPEQIMALFSHTFYENKYGTVGVVTDTMKTWSGDETTKIIEVTPYRTEGLYSDKRRPDEVVFSKKIDDDLSRRDFTINALAFDISNKKARNYEGTLIDLFSGIIDLKKRVVCTVGSAEKRFDEDALRMLRAVRLATELDFEIEKTTYEAIKLYKGHMSFISAERVREEFTRIIMSDRPMKGLSVAVELGLMSFIVPELEKGIGVEQNQAHAFTVIEHLLKSLQHSADKKWSLEIRLAALFHDIAKPETRRFDKTKGDYTFYGHEVVGERVTRNILNRLRYPKELVDTVCKLVRWHMFFSDTEQITLSAVRRMVNNVGRENIWKLMDVRSCDRIGTGRPKENPYRLRKYRAMIEEALRDPITVGMLKIDGIGVTHATNVQPGPKIGFILHALLEEILENPKNNTVSYLEKRALELSKMNEYDLKNLGQKGKERKNEADIAMVEEIRKKHFVK